MPKHHEHSKHHKHSKHSKGPEDSKHHKHAEVVKHLDKHKCPVKIEQVGPNEHCLTGGLKLTTHDKTYYICNGAVGATGPVGPTGPAGATGPTGPAPT